MAIVEHKRSLVRSESVSESFVNFAVAPVAVAHKKPSRILSSAPDYLHQNCSRSTTQTQEHQRIHNKPARSIEVFRAQDQSNTFVSTCPQINNIMASNASTAMPILYQSFRRNMALYPPNDNYYFPIQHLVEYTEEDREMNDGEDTDSTSDADVASVASDTPTHDITDTEDNFSSHPDSSCGGATTPPSSDAGSSSTEITNPNASVEHNDFSGSGSPMGTISGETADTTEEQIDLGPRVRTLLERLAVDLGLWGRQVSFASSIHQLAQLTNTAVRVSQGGLGDGPGARAAYVVVVTMFIGAWCVSVIERRMGA